jgi:hypothetical protein
MVFCEGVNIQMLYSGGAVSTFVGERASAVDDARRIDGVEQAALRPATRMRPNRPAGSRS